MLLCGHASASCVSRVCLGLGDLWQPHPDPRRDRPLFEWASGQLAGHRHGGRVWGNQQRGWIHRCGWIQHPRRPVWKHHVPSGLALLPQLRDLREPRQPLPRLLGRRGWSRNGNRGHVHPRKRGFYRNRWLRRLFPGDGWSGWLLRANRFLLVTVSGHLPPGRGLHVHFVWMPGAALLQHPGLRPALPVYGGERLQRSSDLFEPMRAALHGEPPSPARRHSTHVVCPKLRLPSLRATCARTSPGFRRGGILSAAAVSERSGFVQRNRRPNLRHLLQRQQHQQVLPAVLQRDLQLRLRRHRDLPLLVQSRHGLLLVLPPVGPDRPLIRPRRA
jgi:hypothetical protein